MAHKNIPVFIPHLGCPNLCVFCNQRSISGKNDYSRYDVPKLIDISLSTLDNSDNDIEIAFFGGSFTGIDRDEMIYLLSEAKLRIDNNKIKSIRLSTRPDYINDEILLILKDFGVKSIELGIQSLSEKVLIASKRGHTTTDSINACKLIKSHEFNLVGQMMLGLPESTLEDEIYTLKTLIDHKVDAVRIYPTVVFNDTELNSMMNSGTYIPLSVKDAAERAALLLDILDKANIPCIRLGLQSTDNLNDPEKVTGGAYHPSFGTIARGYAVRNRIEKELICSNFKKTLYPIQMRFAIHPSYFSDASGYKKENKAYFKEKYNIYIKFISDPTLKLFECKIINNMVKNAT